jgi:hypothetical protein
MSTLSPLTFKSVASLGLTAAGFHSTTSGFLLGATIWQSFISGRASFEPMRLSLIWDTQTDNVQDGTETGMRWQPRAVWLRLTPMQTFGSIQARLFPPYFLLQTALSAAYALLHAISLANRAQVARQLVVPPPLGHAARPGCHPLQGAADLGVVQHLATPRDDRNGRVELRGRGTLDQQVWR